MTRQEIVDRIKSLTKDEAKKADQKMMLATDCLVGDIAWNEWVAQVVCTILGINEGDDK